MSLLDALLLEPAPFEVWVAVRADGQKGSGRIDDPYDGGAVHDPQVAITSIVRSGDDKDALVTTPSAHGYANGDYIRIAGATGTDSPYYNGAFLIFGATATSFKYRMKSKPGASAAGTPVAAKIVAFRFDEVLSNLPMNMTLRLGPGVFETQGFLPAAPAPRVQVKSGQKLIGSGMGATTIRLMKVTSETFSIFAIGCDYNNILTSFEASDFTLIATLTINPFPKGSISLPSLAPPSSRPEAMFGCAESAPSTLAPSALQPTTWNASLSPPAGPLRTFPSQLTA
jgi:hypothetical protein